MKRFKAAIIGGSGYGAGEIIRRLLLHPGVDLVRVASIDYVGDNLSAAHPNLEGLTDLTFQKLTPEEAAAGVDVVFLGLPHKVSAGTVPKILGSGAKIIDLSGDFRLKDAAAYEKFYGAVHPCPELLERAVYGLPELNREAIAKADLIASPGCFATAITLGLLPLAKAGLLHGAVETVAITGSSGSGAAPRRHPSPRARAEPQDLQAPRAPAPAGDRADAGHRGRQGFRASLRAGERAADARHLRHELRQGRRRRDQEQLAEAWVKAFASEPFVRVPRKRLPKSRP